MKKLIAAVVLAGAALLATPAAANAAGYAPDSDVSISGNYVAGGIVVINFSEGAFQNNETVNVQITGAGVNDATLGALPVTTVSKAYTAGADGSLPVRVTLPVGGSGSYNLTATGATSGVVGVASFTIAPADVAAGAGNGTGTAANGTNGSLAFTGSTVSTLALWVAGGAVVLGGGLLVVRGSVRRQRETV
ncbi:sortase [Curtobacterium sp. MCJR17_055]|uniref:sortase n=1 Tax=unclassified Curtobacterium TaxID=257496 RepID=UPI000D9E4DE0|nr:MULTISPECIES: sortase [unclassified Curtobacterium]PYY36728.1 sortase [Curtobacterium sp. MCBD17_029]PYY58612.1 sortase [Curtobacterium sp. MCJR17_055]PYY59847.1 sortase [Curtobacterium sp. MCPF17_015]PZE90464.1 sortase [Curtobacterium sp. MCBD17_008]WIB36522.1 sortase [Curtobacterium sp. MCJR17_043]